MNLKPLVQALTGTNKIIIESIAMDSQTEDVLIKVRPPKNEQCRCGICHKKGKRYDHGRGTRRWRALDIGTKRTYIIAEAPRIICPEHGVTTAAVPWARHNSGFCRNLEEVVAWMAIRSTKKDIAEFFRIEWHTVGAICTRVYKDLEKDAPNRYEGLKRIGIDETSYKKGHKYLTIVVNHDTGAVIWCNEGHDAEGLSGFFEQLTSEQRASIECVTADGARWIKSCVEKYCPNAERCIDPFHVVSWAIDVLDGERKKAWKEAAKKVSEESEKKSNHSRKKTDDDDSDDKPSRGGASKKKDIPTLSKKGFRFTLGTNRENLNEYQLAQIEYLSTSNPFLFRAYCLKENLRLLFQYHPDEVEEKLKKWMAWAQRCRIPSFRELRKKIKRHYDAILATVKYGLSNALVESVNNKIKVISRRSYGFRNLDSLFAMIMLSCSNVRPVLPDR